MHTAREKRSSKVNKYLIQITNKYKLKTLEEPYVHRSIASNNSQNYSTLTSNRLLKENDNNPTINLESISESLFDSEEYIKKFNQYKNILEQKISIIKEKIIEEDQQLTPFPRLSINNLDSINLINIKANPFIELIRMFNTNDLYALLHSSKVIKQMIINTLSFEMRTFIANKFEEQTESLFSDYLYYMGIISYDQNNQSKSQIYLIVKAKIASNRLMCKSTNIRYSARFDCDKENVVNHLIFDVKKRPLQYWVMKEYTIFNHDDLNKAYLQHTMQFDLGDYAEFTVNVFAEKGLMYIRQLNWLRIKIYPTPKVNLLEYSNDGSLLREIVDFDTSRYCELELLKGVWNDISLFEDSSQLKAMVNRQFESLFDIRDIVFDDVGYFIFKIYLLAIKTGVIARENNLGIVIKVVSNNLYGKQTLIDESNTNNIVSNEVKKNNLIYDRKNEIQLQLGDTLVFYMSRNK